MPNQWSGSAGHGDREEEDREGRGRSSSVCPCLGKTRSARPGDTRSGANTKTCACSDEVAWRVRSRREVTVAVAASPHKTGGGQRLQRARAIAASSGQAETARPATQSTTRRAMWGGHAHRAGNRGHEFMHDFF
jgi:hypothetical protein